MNFTHGEFLLVNDIYQKLNENIVKGGPFWHLATIKRGAFKEYMAFCDKKNNVFIEELDPQEPGLFKKIKDDNEWNELFNFLKEAGIFTVRKEKEKKFWDLPTMVKPI